MAFAPRMQCANICLVCAVQLQVADHGDDDDDDDVITMMVKFLQG